MRIFLLLHFLIFFSCQQEKDLSIVEQNEKVIIAYVPGFRGELDIEIDPYKITHLNYAFVNVQDSIAVLTNLATDSINFRKLNTLKLVNPDLKILISLGGWSWSDQFSDAVLTGSSRKKFAESCSALVEKYDLDGVDIDWEYPGLRGEDNIFRPEDKQNFTLMFAAIREALDQLKIKSGKEYLLTSAVAGFDAFLDHTEMAEAAKYQDYINVMCYDYFTGGPKAGHHSNLFPPADYDEDRSAQKDIDNFLKAGVPPEKIVFGLPFYGRSWIVKDTTDHGINQPVEQVMRGGGFTFLKDSLIEKRGFIRYWDEQAKSPYLFNHNLSQLVVYDDEESIAWKCRYVFENRLAGVMFWQYASDPKEYLLDVINQNLN